MKLLVDKFCLVVATLFGAGYTPLMPGSASCILAVAVFIIVKDPIAFLIVTLISLVLAFACSGRAEKIYGEKDCKKIVIDDFAGQLVTFLFIPHDIRFILSGFFLFRMFDMLKVPPANRIESLGGAKGIVGDDLVAGIYANAILHLVRFIVFPS